MRLQALDAVRRGHDLHYGGGSPSDEALLDGDRLYAEGLAVLAAGGDLDGVRRLAALITDCARAHAEGRHADAASAWREAERTFG